MPKCAKCGREYDAEFDACPSCSKRDQYSALIAVVIVLGLCGWCWMVSKGLA